MADLGTNINDYVKCKWCKYINQKTELVVGLKNQILTIFCLYECHFKFNNIGRLKIKKRCTMQRLILKSRHGYIRIR